MSADKLGVKYTKTVTNDKSLRDIEQYGHNNPESAEQVLMLWRNGDQVAIENIKAGITELWEKTKNQRVRLTRFFDHHQRGIEYQPDEINRGKPVEWSTKWQLVSATSMQRLTKQKTTGSGCALTEIYIYNNKETSVILTWLVHQQLVKQYRFNKLGSNITWRMSNDVLTGESVKQFFSQLLTYQTTDYADVGDNETDSFLSKMINVGFLETEHSGFYETHGNVMIEHLH